MANNSNISFKQAALAVVGTIVAVSVIGHWHIDSGARTIRNETGPMIEASSRALCEAGIDPDKYC